jgi:hypothetical protein
MTFPVAHGFLLLPLIYILTNTAVSMVLQNPFQILIEVVVIL